MHKSDQFRGLTCRTGDNSQSHMIAVHFGVPVRLWLGRDEHSNGLLHFRNGSSRKPNRSRNSDKNRGVQRRFKVNEGPQIGDYTPRDAIEAQAELSCTQTTSSQNSGHDFLIVVRQRLVQRRARFPI